MYYDDNFGHWDVEGEEDLEFYKKVQEISIEKECVGCRRIVKIMPQYDVCNSCATQREQGWDF